MLNLTGIKSAVGLSQGDSELVDELVSVLNRNHDKHAMRRAFYEDKIAARNLGMRMPREYAAMPCATGWAAKSVNALAERSTIDSFSAGTLDEATAAEFSRVMDENDVKGAYSMALSSMLIEGCGFWTVSKGDKGEPAAIISYHSATTAAALWDYRRKRVRCGLVVTDFARFGKSPAYIPSEAILYCGDYVAVLKRTDRNAWVSDYKDNPVGRPLIVPMVYKREDGKPFGRSRITKAVMTYTEAAMDELRSMALQSGYFSIPTKYALGLSEAQYDDMAKSIHEAYRADMLLMTTNDEGGTPSVGMMQGADMTPHIAVLDKLASLMASETSLPVATFGVAGNGYTSSDALRASSDDLVVLADSMNAANARTMRDVSLLALSIIEGKPFDKLDDSDRSVHAVFDSTEMRSSAAEADRAMKIATVAPSYAGSPLFLRDLGYGEDDRNEMLAYAAANKQLEIAANLFGA